MFLWETLRENLPFLAFTTHLHPFCGPFLHLQRVLLQSLLLHDSFLSSRHPYLHLIRTLITKLGPPDYLGQSPHLKLTNMSHLQNPFQGKGHLWGTIILSTIGPNEQSVLMSRMNEHREQEDRFSVSLPCKITVTSMQNHSDLPRLFACGLLLTLNRNLVSCL